MNAVLHEEKPQPLNCITKCCLVPFMQLTNQPKCLSLIYFPCLGVKKQIKHRKPLQQWEQRDGMEYKVMSGHQGKTLKFMQKQHLKVLRKDCQKRNEQGLQYM